MTEFVELRDREVPEQLIVISEEYIKNYRIKRMTNNDMDTVWLFRDGTLQGVLAWTGMLAFNEFKQILCYYPEPEPTLIFGQWEPEPTATDADYAMMLSYIQREFNGLGPKNRKEGSILQGLLTLELDPLLDSVDLMLDGIPFLRFTSQEDEFKLIDVEDVHDMFVIPHFDFFQEEAITAFLPDIGEVMMAELIMQLPETGTIIH